ncbi:uncharacterized protein ARMOST_08062 [Armillaria ostoyae]|uniref:Uncharacterized protein n=1 Tax=Armillaria ostoyae TaxID=47428 RepID=A0A284R7K9_ARMOS|nr:uncharacterized protein ARMOST_08062 [Armillaria ostoyae]
MASSKWQCLSGKYGTQLRYKMCSTRLVLGNDVMTIDVSPWTVILHRDNVSMSSQQGRGIVMVECLEEVHACRASSFKFKARTLHNGQRLLRHHNVLTSSKQGHGIIEFTLAKYRTHTEWRCAGTYATSTTTLIANHLNSGSSNLITLVAWGRGDPFPKQARQCPPHPELPHHPRLVGFSRQPPQSFKISIEVVWPFPGLAWQLVVHAVELHLGLDSYMQPDPYVQCQL